MRLTGQWASHRPVSKKGGRVTGFFTTALVKKSALGYNGYHEYTDTLRTAMNKAMDEPGRFSAPALERMIE